MGPVVDAETGFQYLRARYYDPATGQFLTRDPIEAQTREPYGYVGGNPLNRVDPSGLCWGPTCIVEDVAGAVDAGWDATGGRAVSYVADHPVGALKVASVGLAVTALVAAPVTGGTSLAALPTILGAGSVATSVAAEAIDGKPGKPARVTFALGLGILGGGVAGAFDEGGLAAAGLLTNLLLLGADFLEVGQRSPRYC